MKKEEKEKKVKKETKKVEKKSKKNIIIAILCVIIIALAIVLGCFIYKNHQENKTTGSEWSDKYYEFLKEQSKQDNKNQALKEKVEISFVDTKSTKDPMMIVKNNYESDNKKYDNIAVYSIEDGEVTFLNGFSSEKAEVKLYYETSKKEYKYYIHNKDLDLNKYISLDTVKYDYDNYNLYKELEKEGIKDYESKEYQDFTKEFYEKQSKDENREELYSGLDDKVVQKTLDGKTLEYSKIDEKLVDTGNEPKYFEYDKDMKPTEIRKEVVEGKDNYQDINDLLTKEIEKIVKEQLDLIDQVKKDIENAKKEIKADEERKAKEAAEALLKQGLKVGSHTLKYGKYTTSVPNGGPDGKDLYGTIILEPNGKFHIKTNFEQSSGNSKTLDEDGTYTTGKSYNSYDKQDTIFFTTKSGYKFSYFVTNNKYFNSQWIIYNYKG